MRVTDVLKLKFIICTIQILSEYKKGYKHMKKNLISVVILALVFGNLVLTAIMMFTVLPETKKANNLIDQVCQAISLDINNGAGVSAANLPQDQIVDYALNADGETMTLNFATSEDGETHYLVCNISLSLNKESKGYEQYQGDLSSKKNIILADITDIVGQYTMEEYSADKTVVSDKILTTLQKKFGTDFIVGVNFVSALTQ